MLKVARDDEAWVLRLRDLGLEESSDGVALPSARRVLLYEVRQRLYETAAQHGCPATVTQRCSDPVINTNLVLPLHQLPSSLTDGRVGIHPTHLANMNLRKAPASSMQKTYDECYLTCSTAIYFEGQVG